MLPLLLDLPSYYKFHKVEKLWRVKTRVFSYIRVKKIMFYTEFVTHQVDFAYFFSLILLMKTDNKINFSRSNYSAENSLRAIVVFFQWFFKWKLFEYIYFFFQAKKLSSIFNSFGTAKRERWRLCNFFFVFGCVRVRNCFSLYFTALQ